MTIKTRTRIDWGESSDWDGGDDRDPAVMLRAEGLKGTLRLTVDGDEDPTEARRFLADHLIMGASDIRSTLEPDEQSVSAEAAEVLSALGHALRDLVKGEDW